MKKFLFTSLISGILFGCSSDDNSLNSNNSDNNQAQSSILPVKIVISTNSLNTTTAITYDGDKIKEANITYSGIENYSEKHVYQYDGDYITKITGFNKNGLEDMTREYVYQNGKVSKKVVTEWGSRGLANEQKHMETSNYEWIDDNHVKETKTSNGNNLVNTTEYFYTNGNLMKSLNRNEEVKYTYDDKENPFKNIKGIQQISFDDNEINKNNVLTFEQTNNSSKHITSFLYEYRSDSLPSKVVETSTSSETATAEYSYNK